MRVLYSETPDKSARSFLTLTKDALLERIKMDHGYHECIPMMNDNIVRVYLDIDAGGDNPAAILRNALDILNSRFDADDADWAVASCNRQEAIYKISYHILSRKYCMKLSALRILAKTLNSMVPLDFSSYFPYNNDHEDNGYMRLPNQTKNSINKPAPALIVEAGDLWDFLITDTERLVEYHSI
jgi:hypothetical protein